MRSGEALRRALCRTDVLAGLAGSSLLVLLLCTGGMVLYAWVAMESLEEADRWMQHSLAVVEDALATEVSSGGAFAEVGPLLLPEGASLRIQAGDLVRSLGPWPASERIVPTLQGDDVRNLSAFRLLRKENHLVGHMALPGGASAELALSLRHFRSEAGEAGSIILLVTAGAVVGAVMLWIASIHLAFAPLRRATTLVREVDARSLESRLPTRSTADPIDLHAEALNQVLEKVDASFSRLRAFSADVAHELRTPINRVHTVVEVALRSEDERELRSALETVEATTSELSGMVDSLLLLAEIDERRFRPRLSGFDSREWVRDAVDFYAPLFEEREITLSSHIDRARIVGDRALLDRVLSNLLENALHHTRPGDKVEIRAGSLGKAYRLSVDDSGPGIGARDSERIFDRFVRLAPGEVKGSGLGLPLAKAIVRLHGGSLLAEPSPLGGLRLVLELPPTG